MKNDISVDDHPWGKTHSETDELPEFEIEPEGMLFQETSEFAIEEESEFLLEDDEPEFQIGDDEQKKREENPENFASEQNENDSTNELVTHISPAINKEGSSMPPGSNLAYTDDILNNHTEHQLSEKTETHAPPPPEFNHQSDAQQGIVPTNILDEDQLLTPSQELPEPSKASECNHQSDEPEQTSQKQPPQQTPGQQFATALHYIKQENDHAVAARWFRKAAMQGHARSQMYLGLLFVQGNGVPKSFFHAYAWFSLSASQNLTEAISARKKLEPHLTAKDCNAALKYAADLWHEMTMTNF